MGVEEEQWCVPCCTGEVLVIDYSKALLSTSSGAPGISRVLANGMEANQTGPKFLLPHAAQSELLPTLHLDVNQRHACPAMCAIVV